MSDELRFEWSKENFEKSLSGSCWWYTAYDGGWDDSHKYGYNLRDDTELKEIVQTEFSLRPIPAWAADIATRTIGNIPPCGHYSFPEAYIKVVDAIGSQQPMQFFTRATRPTQTARRKLWIIASAWMHGFQRLHLRQQQMNFLYWVT